ncbi:MAG: alpha/beta hydrolase [Candidatus Bathyarchaeota archaeon]|nr:alpha/beta hydrolase [Candidatus Bathyarchaeota archaeon]
MKKVNSFAEINGGKIYYEMLGEGQPLVFINGGNMDCRMWDDQFEEFAQYYRVIRYDFRGSGKSEMPKKPFYIINDLYELLKFLDVDKAYIVGLSLGGSIAIQFTIEHPDMVDALVLVGSGLIGFKWSEEHNRRIMKIFMSVKDEKSALNAMEEWLRDPYMAPAMEKPNVARKLRKICLENYRALLIDRTLGSQPNEPSILRLSEIATPTLVIIGDQDVPDIHAVGDVLEKNIRGAKKIVIKGAGHIVNMEKPKEFNQTVLNFLEKLK